METKTTRTVPTASQVDVLMSDWLGNLRASSSGNYTHKGKGGIRRAGGETITDYLVGKVTGLSDIELIREARLAANRVVNSVTSTPIDIQVGGTGSFHAREENGRQVINLATNYFDDKTLDSRDKIEIMLGLASHESAHAVYTDPDEVERMLKGEPSETAELKKDIWNIIEDERIEYLLGDDRPGLSDSLGACKRYYYKKLLQDLRADGKMPTEPLPRLLSTLAQAVRYPSELDKQDVCDNFDELDAIRKALTPFPLTPEETTEATEKVMQIVRNLIKEQMQQEQQQQQGGQQGQQGGQDGDSPQQPSGQQSSSSPSGDGDSGKDQKKKQSGKKKEPTAKQVNEAISKALQTNEGKKVSNALKKDEAKGDPSRQSSSIRNSRMEEFVNSDDSEMEHGGPGCPDMFVLKPKGSPMSYNLSLSEVRRFIPAMSKALSCKSHDTDYALNGMPSGRLNTNKLVSLSCGNPNVFTRQGTVRCSSASVCILLDESGSMGGLKLTTARAASILVNEAVARIPKVNFYCYGYTSALINVYSENGKTSRWSLGDTQALGGTPTGTAMAVVAKRLRRFTKDPVLMLVLTDGSADDTQRVIDEVDLLSRDRIECIGVGILTSYVKSSFKESVVINDLSTFALDLGRLTRGRLDRMLVRTDTL